MGSGVKKRTGIERFLRVWNEKPLFSTGIVLLLLIVIQTLIIGFDYPSVGDWFDKWFRNWVNIISNNSYVGIISLGMTLVIISGGIDLAVGSTLACVGALMMVLLNTGSAGPLTQLGITGMPTVILSLAAGLLVGCLLGELTGVIVSKGRIPPFIATLGMMKILRSVTQYFMQGVTQIQLPEAFLAISAPVFGYRLMPIVYWMVMAAAIYMVSTKTVFGRRVYAVGSNERATRLSGVNVDKVKRRVYAVMGLCVSVATIVQVSRIGSMDYASTGSGYELDAIAAVIVGGTSMAGGKGSVMGTIIGMLIIAVMNNLLTLVGVHPFLREAFKGAIIIGAVLLQRKTKET